MGVVRSPAISQGKIFTTQSPPIVAIVGRFVTPKPVGFSAPVMLTA
jgi:hypothetical protein